ncbi:hypothetical protein [Ruegeria arenilitoris]|uniref:hypothetical protein n=1 Tax=Ruegeria arenilitoris TaxID=1173585 RepID=UPI0014809EEB|nr:hypothetical protein [Ruegeria arenilitoris]
MSDERPAKVDSEKIQLLQLAMDQAARTNTYWNIYVAVVTAIFAVLASGKAPVDKRVFKLALSALFLVFAIGNLRAIEAVGEVRTALAAVLGAEFKEITVGLKPASEWGYRVFHGLLDAAIVACILFVKWPAPSRD